MSAHVDDVFTLGRTGATLLRLGCDPQMIARLCSRRTLTQSWVFSEQASDLMWIIGRAIQSGWSGFDRFCRYVIEPIVEAGPSNHGREQYERLKVATGARYAIASDIVSWGRIHLSEERVLDLLLPFATRDMWASIDLDEHALIKATVTPELVWLVIESDARLAVDAMNGLHP